MVIWPYSFNLFEYTGLCSIFVNNPKDIYYRNEYRILMDSGKNVDLLSLRIFLDALPKTPCDEKMLDEYCSICKKVNADVYYDCQKLRRKKGLLMEQESTGDVLDIEDIIRKVDAKLGHISKEEAEKKSDVTFEVMKTNEETIIDPFADEADGDELPMIEIVQPSFKKPEDEKAIKMPKTEEKTIVFEKIDDDEEEDLGEEAIFELAEPGPKPPKPEEHAGVTVEGVEEAEIEVEDAVVAKSEPVDEDEAEEEEEPLEVQPLEVEPMVEDDDNEEDDNLPDDAVLDEAWGDEDDDDDGELIVAAIIDDDEDDAAPIKKVKKPMPTKKKVKSLKKKHVAPKVPRSLEHKSSKKPVAPKPKIKAPKKVPMGKPAPKKTPKKVPMVKPAPKKIPKKKPKLKKEEPVEVWEVARIDKSPASKVKIKKPVHKTHAKKMAIKKIAPKKIKK